MADADWLLIPVDADSVPLPGQMTFFPETPTTVPKKPVVRHCPDLQPTLFDAHLVRILLCCVMTRLPESVPESWLYEIAVVSGEISFFLYADALGFLLDNGSLAQQDTADGTRTLSLTAVGRECATKLRGYVPKPFRDRLTLTALRYVARKRALRDLSIAYEQQDGDWVLCMQCKDHAREMFSMRFHAPNKAEAEALAECILRNPAAFFGKILDFAMNNEEEVFDLSDN